MKTKRRSHKRMRAGDIEDVASAKRLNTKEQIDR
jgi:hypothetical protein